MHWRKFTGWLAIVFCALPARAVILDPTALVRVATVSTIGNYDNAQLSYWNGQPLSASNHPSSYEDELSATLDFYVDPSVRSTLYLAATDVRDTNFGNISGPPFGLVTFTGITFSLGGAAPAAYSGAYALTGERLLGPASGAAMTLLTTPGWALSQQGTNYSLSASATDFGLTHFPSVYGATRIAGGGVFALNFDPSVDLLARDFELSAVSASNGNGAYQEVGTISYLYSAQSVPEPAAWNMMLVGFGACGWLARSRNQIARSTSEREVTAAG